MGKIENNMAIASKTTALLLLCTAVIASGSRAPNPSPRRSGSGSGSGTSAPTSLAPTLAPSSAPTKYPTGAPANTPTNTPTVGYTAAATQITQTIVQTIPGVDSAATFNAEPNVKSAYEKGYGSVILITDTASDGSITYKTGCSVDAYAADTRRAAMNVQYSSVVSDASGVDTTTTSAGITDASAFVTAVAAVVASDTTAYSSVTAPSASDITTITTATSVSISGGTAAPTSGSSDSSDLETYIIVLIVIGGVLVVGLVVVVVVKVMASGTESKAQNTMQRTNDQPIFSDVAVIGSAASGTAVGVEPAKAPAGDESAGPAVMEQTAGRGCFALCSADATSQIELDEAFPSQNDQNTTPAVTEQPEDRGCCVAVG